MKLQQATRYAIWAVIELASRPDEQIPAQELAKTYQVSQSHLVRILHALTRANIVTSVRGPGGGFAFCGNAKRLTLYDIICLFETGWPSEEGEGELCSPPSQSATRVPSLRVPENRRNARRLR